MATEAERVRQSGAHGALLCLVEGEVQIVVDLGILVALLVVDGGGDDVVLHGEHGGHGLYGTGGTEQVAGHGLRRRDVQFVGCVAEDFLDGLGLRDVAHMGRGAVHIDVVDVLGLHAGILQGVLHHQLGTQSLGMGGGDVVSVGTHAGTYHLGVDLRTASLGMLQLLEDETAGTLGHDESVARGAERTAGLLGLVIARREGVHGVEAAHAGLCDGSLGTTGHDGVGLAQTNQVEGIGQCVARRGAGARGDIVRSVQTVHNRDLAGSNVGNHLRDEEGVELRTLVVMSTVVHHLLLEGLDAADAHTEHHADAVLVFLLQVPAAVLHSLLGGNEGQLRVAVHLACLLAVEVLVHVEVLHLAGERGLKQGGIKLCNRSGSADTLEHVLPHLLRGVAQRCNGTQSCYDDSFQFHNFLLFKPPELGGWGSEQTIIPK